MSKGDRDFNTKLVEAVERHACLYDYKHKDYNYRNKVQLAWENIAKDVKQTAKECKESWRNLRIVYTRALKKPSSGSGVKKKSWYLLENMSFLKPYVNITMAKSLPGNLPSPPNTDESEVFGEQNSEINESVIHDDIHDNTNDDGNISSVSANITNVQSIQNPMGPPKKKKKTQINADEYMINYIQSKSSHCPNEDNPKKHFLLSLLPDLEEMSTTQFRIFRHEVVNLIDRVLEDNHH